MGKLLLKIDKQSDFTPVVSRNIFCEDGTTHLVQSTFTGGTARPTGQFEASVSYEVPVTVQDGSTCTFEFQNDYQVNPLRTITKKWQSEQFKVIGE